MKNENLYLNIINNLRDGVYFVDLDRHITFWNRAAEDISGYSAEEIVGRKCDDNLLSHIDGDGRPLCVIGCPLFASMIDNRHRREHVFMRHKKGHRVPTLVNVYPVIEGGKTIGAVEIYTAGSPVACDDNLIEQLADRAMKDQVTGLPNRSYLESFLEFKFNEFSRFKRLFMLLLLKIDGLGAINNSYGHDIGESLLKGISASIQQSVSRDDLFGRWGDEEFVGIFSIRQPNEASILRKKIWMLTANTQVPFGEERLSAAASIGLAIIDEADTVESLLERADNLMDQCKFGGESGHYGQLSIMTNCCPK